MDLSSDIRQSHPRYLCNRAVFLGWGVSIISLLDGSTAFFIHAYLSRTSSEHRLHTLVKESKFTIHWLWFLFSRLIHLAHSKPANRFGSKAGIRRPKPWLTRAYVWDCSIPRVLTKSGDLKKQDWWSQSWKTMSKCSMARKLFKQIILSEGLKLKKSQIY